MKQYYIDFVCIWQSIYPKHKNCCARKMLQNLRHFYEHDSFFAREILLLLILTGKTVNSVQEFVKMKSVFLLVFFIFLHNQWKFHNFRTPGNRRTSKSYGTPGPLRNLVPLWNPRDLHGSCEHQDPWPQ